jgi:predicted transcriptional regulator
MEFYLATKNNKILSLTGKWMELENIILSEDSQDQDQKSHVLSMCNIDLTQMQQYCETLGTLREGHIQEG